MLLHERETLLSTVDWSRLSWSFEKRVSRSKQAGEVGEGKNGRGVGGDPVLPIYGQEEVQVSEEMEKQIEE